MLLSHPTGNKNYASLPRELSKLEAIMPQVNNFTVSYHAYLTATVIHTHTPI